jgi:hypothetical protein
MRKSALALVGTVAIATGLSGCAGIAAEWATTGPPAAAPQLQVGASWTYRGRDGFRLPVVWEETRRITAAGADGYSVAVTMLGPALDIDRRESWTVPGLVESGALMDIETRRFAKPLERYRFPLVPGETWNQWVGNYNETTQKAGSINRYVRVGGWERIDTPAGSFDAIHLRVLMQLDDEDVWRGPTHCNYVIWYAPAVGAPVREEKDAEYYEKGDARNGISVIHAQPAVLELVSYTPR